MKRWSVLVTAVLSFSILAGCAGGERGPISLTASPPHPAECPESQSPAV